jgi:hypothetical protein
MEILINELSLNGQFLTVEQFIADVLIKFDAILRECDRNQDVIILQKQDFWNCKVTQTENLYSILKIKSVKKSDEISRFKLLLGNLKDEQYWENSPKHNVNDNYEYNGNNIAGSSLAESCERDKVVISFILSGFSSTKLQIFKNRQKVNIDNLFEKWHYSEVAYCRGQMTECEYFDKKCKAGKISLLENKYRFSKTNIDTAQSHGEIIYKEIKTAEGKNTARYWYLDNFHKSHYEVFDSNGNHLGEADLQGKIDTAKKDSRKTIVT